MIGNSLFGFSPRNSGQFFAVDANTGQTQWLSEPRQGENAAVGKAGNLWFALEADAELVVAALVRLTASAVRRTYGFSNTAATAIGAIAPSVIVMYITCRFGSPVGVRKW